MEQSEERVEERIQKRMVDMIKDYLTVFNKFTGRKSSIKSQMSPFKVR